MDRSISENMLPPPPPPLYRCGGGGYSGGIWGGRGSGDSTRPSRPLLLKTQRCKFCNPVKRNIWENPTPYFPRPTGHVASIIYILHVAYLRSIRRTRPSWRCGRAKWRDGCESQERWWGGERGGLPLRGDLHFHWKPEEGIAHRWLGIRRGHMD